MRIPITVTIAQREGDGNTTFVREVALFGWVVKREEVYTEGECSQRSVGFTAFPDERVYTEDED